MSHNLIRTYQNRDTGLNEIAEYFSKSTQVLAMLIILQHRMTNTRIDVWLGELHSNLAGLSGIVVGYLIMQSRFESHLLWNSTRGSSSEFTLMAFLAHKGVGRRLTAQIPSKIVHVLIFDTLERDSYLQNFITFISKV